VEKERLLFLTKNYTSLTAEEVTDLMALQKEFPYSQLLHNLSSRGGQDLNISSRQELLHVSAIYSTDRGVLKSIMTTPSKPRAKAIVQSFDERPRVESNQVPVKASMPQVTSEINLSGEALINDIFKELDKLKVVRHNFEVSVEEYEKVTGSNSKRKDDPKKTEKKVSASASVKEPTDVLIEEIKSTKKKVVPEGPKQKEQIEIIENFIKTQPSITKNKLAAAPPSSTDLAEKSLVYGDNIISETLVEILLKQGKKDKAIEVLKKLIWKFPQKKAYFAAQIEELKN
jgi:hypothetical protein